MSAKFDTRAVQYMTDLIRDFPKFEDFQAAGFPANFGVETGAFEHVQELNPTSGRGGLGDAQWTGDRREEFEGYLAIRRARGQSSDPREYEPNYGMLFRELDGGEGRRVLPKLYDARDVDEATEIVMREYERPGVPHLDKRKEYGRRALAAFRAAGIDVARLRAEGRPGTAAALPTPLPSGTSGTSAANPIGGIIGLIESHQGQARLKVLQVVGIFNAVYPTDPIVVQTKQPATSADQVKSGQPTSVKVAAWAGAAGFIAQLLGAVAPPEVLGPIIGAATPPSTAGTLVTALPIIAGIVGKLGGFSPLVGIGSTILDMFVKRRST